MRYHSSFNTAQITQKLHVSCCTSVPNTKLVLRHRRMGRLCLRHSHNSRMRCHTGDASNHQVSLTTMRVTLDAKPTAHLLSVSASKRETFRSSESEKEMLASITFKTVKWKNTSQSLFRITAEVIKVGCASCADKDLKMGLTISERSIAKMWSRTFGGTRLRRGVQSQDEGATRTMMHSRRSALAL